MKAISVVLLLGWTAICVRCAGLELPEPPQQHKSWHPDAASPPTSCPLRINYMNKGFPDPRGCEYREIEVEVSGVWDGKASLVKTRGWVLPKKSGTNQFAICWNGLDLSRCASCPPLPTCTRKWTSSNSPAMSRRFGSGGGSAIGEVGSVIYANALSTRVLLLLRCGETAAALTNWSPNQQMMILADLAVAEVPVPTQ